MNSDLYFAFFFRVSAIRLRSVINYAALWELILWVPTMPAHVLLKQVSSDLVLEKFCAKFNAQATTLRVGTCIFGG